MLFKYFKKNKLELDFIHELLLSVEDLFVPALSEEIDLYLYAEKLQKYANCLLIEDEDKVIAFIFFYIIDKTTLTLYITLICSLKHGCGQKVYHELINNMTPKIVKLEVDGKNVKAISFYEKLGFVSDGVSQNENKLKLKHQL